MNEIEKKMMLGMINILNEASEAYYNTGNPIMTDEQFDARLNDLKQFEEETGIVFSHSPTQRVGARVLNELTEVTHTYSMLSLDKCHTINELLKFINNKETIASIKLDGLTCRLTYKDGLLIRAETRGDGIVGSDITEHIKQFPNVPFKIKKEGTYTIDGEVIITKQDFEEINEDNEYKNPRNLAAGTLSALDTSLVTQRRLRFLGWDVIEGGANSLRDNLNEAKKLSFDVVPFWFNDNSANALNPENLQSNIDYVFDYAEECGFPCDGVVFKFDDIEYGKSLGQTSHHFKNGIAYKREDDTYRTKLIDIKYDVGKSGVLTPVAIFEPVEIEGTVVEKASLHNISVMESILGKRPYKGQKIWVKKSNMVIPQVVSSERNDE